MQAHIPVSGDVARQWVACAIEHFQEKRLPAFRGNCDPISNLEQIPFRLNRILRR
jgi:hypothetical protein